MCEFDPDIVSRASGLRRDGGGNIAIDRLSPAKWPFSKYMY